MYYRTSMIELEHSVSDYKIRHVRMRILHVTKVNFDIIVKIK